MGVFDKLEDMFKTLITILYGSFAVILFLGLLIFGILKLTDNTHLVDSLSWAIFFIPYGIIVVIMTIWQVISLKKEILEVERMTKNKIYTKSDF